MQQNQMPQSPMPQNPMQTNPMQANQMQMQQVQAQQQAVSPMMIGSPHMRRPPSNGSINNSQVVQNVQNQIHYGGGGGSNSYPIPFPPDGYVYRKPGLFGGSPIHGFSRNPGTKHIQTQASTSSSAGQSQAPQTSNPVVIVATRSDGLQNFKEINNVTILKKKPTVKVSAMRSASSTRTIMHRGGKVANIMRQEDFDDASNASTISSPGNLTAIQTQTVNRNIKRTVSDSCYTTDITEDIVVIDSSPDEKQRIMDYDDDNDKSVIGPEVSLSSVAQSVVDVDDVSVMYDATTR